MTITKKKKLVLKDCICAQSIKSHKYNTATGFTSLYPLSRHRTIVVHILHQCMATKRDVKKQKKKKPYTASFTSLFKRKFKAKHTVRGIWALSYFFGRSD